MNPEKPFSPPQLIVREDAPFEGAIRRFKTMIHKERILQDYKERSRYEKPSEKRNKARRLAQKRLEKANNS